MLSRLLRGLLVLIVLCGAAAAFAVQQYQQWLQTPLQLSDDHVLMINPGDNLTKVSQKLAEDGVLKWPEMWVLYAKLTERTQIKTGEYQLQASMTPDQLLDLLQSDQVISYSVTLVEGKTFKDFLQRLHSQEKIIATLKGKTQQEVLKELGLELEHPEGWFFPETYSYTSGTTDRDILLQAYQKMKTVLDEEWAKREKNLPYKNAYEALIMASIIEKETGVAYERPEIAGVFVRRLRKGMRLQTDPTIIYGMGDRYDGNIRRKDLREATPYNTYVIDGLPPTPIAMPGREAINAALHPKPGKSLYFVAKGDGSHYFSATLKEHNRAVREYQLKKRAKNYRSSPE